MSNENVGVEDNEDTETPRTGYKFLVGGMLSTLLLSVPFLTVLFYVVN